MAKSKIIAGLEIGTTATRMVVGEIHPDASATIIGVGEVKSAGVERGEIQDMAYARQCVRDAWQLAQNHADVDILNVYLSVTGDHIVGVNNVGSFRLRDDEDKIEEEHVNAAREKAEKLDLPPDSFCVNRELGGYAIDGGEPIRNPEGLSGRTLDVNCHIMHGKRSRLQNSLECVREVPLEVEDVVFAPLATAQMVLTRQQKESGALLIDMGGGTTDYICYKSGNVVASGCVPMGGIYITKQIMKRYESRASLSFRAAEWLKCNEGNASGDANDLSEAYYRSENGLEDVKLQRGLLNKYIETALLEIMKTVLEKMRSCNPAELFRSGMSIYLVGGTSQMTGIEGVFHKIFGKNVPIIRKTPSEHKNYLSDPRYCTAIGLIRYAQRYDNDALESHTSGTWSRFLRFLGIGR